MGRSNVLGGGGRESLYRSVQIEQLFIFHPLICPPCIILARFTGAKEKPGAIAKAGNRHVDVQRVAMEDDVAADGDASRVESDFVLAGGQIEAIGDVSQQLFPEGRPLRFILRVVAERSFCRKDNESSYFSLRHSVFSFVLMTNAIAPSWDVNNLVVFVDDWHG